MPLLPDSLLSGENAPFLDAEYQRWLADPGSVDSDLAALFDGLEGPSNGKVPGSGPSFRPASIFAPRAGGTADPAAIAAASRRQAAVVQLVNAYRVRGHFQANIDPLGSREQITPPELTLSYYGVNDSELDHMVDTRSVYGMPDQATVREVVERCQQAYTGSIGAEFMNIDDLTQKQWVQEQLETLPVREVLNKAEQKWILRKLCDAENFERLLHTKFPGTKRFSLEGAETLVPLLELLNEHAGSQGVREIVIGMAHRGRLNTLVNLMGKPASAVVAEFEDQGGPTEGSGDVKYHKGYSANTTTVGGHAMHLSLTPNPSHLEAVDPIVEGRVRAKQDRTGDVKRERCMPLLIHGDAAFAGQGLVSEVLNLSELAGYRAGGTLHVIVNNQIGFTTPPAEARSTPYATGPARMLGVPIFHVNGEDPRAVAAVVSMAVEFRQRFKRDVVIDMYCYRKHGHNEGDEPSYTQPLMYKIIRSRPTPREVYQQILVEKGDLEASEAKAIFDASLADMNADAAEKGKEPTAPVSAREVGSKGEDPDLKSYFDADVENAVATHRVEMGSPSKERWEKFKGGDIRTLADTRFDADTLRRLLTQVNTPPEGLKVHAKVKRLLGQRMTMIEGKRGLDWSMGEQAAFASLLHEGHPVRLSGQDCGRGTFSHRHAVITDIETAEEYFPLDHINDTNFWVFDSSLSEAGVLGFELGFSYDMPEGLVMWEAQFGDFANGAQVIVDQFISSTEQKWNRLSGLVMLLPHGYAGQGPEHSSARLERYLLQCAEDNMQVANVTTPAQYFHMMRNQVVRQVRKPLIVMTPKSLLRHELATSTLEEMAEGAFQRVLPEVDTLGKVRRVVLCSGKVYYELLRARRERKIDDVALIRVEMLYPYPEAEIAAVLASYGDAELLWVQEEPKNMGAWPMMAHWLWEHLGPGSVRYAGRKAAASPATGSHHAHKREQAAVIDAAFA